MSFMKFPTLTLEADQRRIDTAVVERDALTETTDHIPRGIFTFGVGRRLPGFTRAYPSGFIAP
jgi:hypothetical protein